MKKIVASALTLLIIASLALAQAKAGNAAVEQTLIDMEKQLWEAWKNKSAEAFGRHLGDNFIIVEQFGVARGKSVVVNQITSAACDVTSYSLSDTKVDWLTKDMALVTYKADQDATCGGQKIPSPVYAASLWQKKNGQWLSVYHQETVAGQQSSQPTPAQ
jgi:hypothetical protein